VNGGNNGTEEYVQSMMDSFITPIFDAEIKGGPGPPSKAIDH
jgi:hypothetical protein